jgi:hypothetical protein
MRTYRLTAVFIGLLIMGGCASIPKESPELSQEIGKRVADMRTVHINLVHSYFGLKRERVNELFEEEWIPAYAESFFSRDKVSSYWEKLVSEDDKEERVRFLVQLGPPMLDRIRAKRAEYMEPLDRLESQIIDSLQHEYRQILSANNTLTSFLASSSKVVRDRERYMELFGVPQREIDAYIDKIDRRSEEVMETIRNANLN